MPNAVPKDRQCDQSSKNMNLVYCLVSLLGAFLLFQIQPVISKFILPWFGGSPGVWTTAMLFFQVLLFGGYSYAHFLTKWRPRQQAWVHGAALLAALLLLPIVPGDTLKPTGDEEPVSRILLLLLRTVGLPYLVLSATSPLIQVWFSHQYPNRSPWRLYSLSNIGSLTALLSYPVLFESRWDVLTQAKVWSGAFAVFVVLMLVCAIANRMRGNDITPEGDLHPQAATHGVRPTWKQRAIWLALPGFASLMLLATTNHVCMDVAVIPFLWILPLSLYLLSFIICFDHPRWYRRAVWAVPAMAVIFLSSALYELDWEWEPTFVTELAIYIGSMFLVCMVCHGELARTKPSTRYLTEYYLLISAGGALGGLAVSVIAPLVFVTFVEWSLALLAGFALVTWVSYRALTPDWSGIKLALWRTGWIAIALAALVPMSTWELTFSECLARTRNFYGVLSVSEYEDEDNGETFRSFWCNGILHGRQNMMPGHRREPLTYFGKDTGIGMVLDSLKTRPDARVGIIGLGVGAVACYAEPGHTFRFYEINPEAVDLALNFFTFIADMKARGAHYELALGDARLRLEHEEAQHFDVIHLDAFSGDSVPIHLLTREAFDLYLRHLKPDGVIVVNITNHYINLAPVIERVAQEFGMATTRIAREADDFGAFHSDYMVLSRDEQFIKAHPPVIPDYARQIEVPLWTDHRHNLFQIMRHD